jgi:phosphate uptake regulator
MHADAMEALRGSDAGLAENVLARDDEVDRLYWFVAKQQSMISRDPAVARKMGMGVSEASFYLSAAKALERIADHAARIAHSASALSSERKRQAGQGHRRLRIDRAFRPGQIGRIASQD